MNEPIGKPPEAGSSYNNGDGQDMQDPSAGIQQTFGEEAGIFISSKWF